MSKSKIWKNREGDGGVWPYEIIEKLKIIFTDRRKCILELHRYHKYLAFTGVF